MFQNSPFKIIFFGTSEFAVPSLRALIGDGVFEVAAVITRPDRPVGRKQIIAPPPVKAAAEEAGIKVYQPEKIKEFLAEMKKIAPDAAVLASYGKIIPEEMLAIPRFGFVNVHASLLPAYRGASPIEAAILNGEKATGITIMKMDSGLDTGGILAQNSLKITTSDTAETLEKKLALTGAELLPETLKNYFSGELEAKPQDNSLASYAPALKKEDGRIDWNLPAEKIERLTRAMNPRPGAFCFFKRNGKDLLLKILKTDPTPIKNESLPAGKFFIHNDKLAIQCADFALIINKLQLEGGKPMTGEEFIKGHKIL